MHLFLSKIRILRIIVVHSSIPSYSKMIIHRRWLLYVLTNAVRSLRCCTLYADACEIFHKMNIFSWCMSQIRNKTVWRALSLESETGFFFIFNAPNKNYILCSLKLLTHTNFLCFLFSDEESLNAIRGESSRVIISENK